MNHREDKRMSMNIVCLDLEGVLVPEIWIAFAKESVSGADPYNEGRTGLR